MIQEKPSSSWEMKNYQLYLVQRNWKRFKRQCFFFLVQRWKTYQLFNNSCNRCRIRMGILDKNSSRSFSWRTALKLSYFSQLQRNCLDRRINQCTSWIFQVCEKIQRWYLKNRLTNHQHPDDMTRGSFKRIIQENRSRGSFEIIIFTPSSELTRELWRGCEYYSPVNNLSCLEIKVVSKMRKNRFWNQCWF